MKSLKKGWLLNWAREGQHCQCSKINYRVGVKEKQLISRNTVKKVIHLTKKFIMKIRKRFIFIKQSKVTKQASSSNRLETKPAWPQAGA